MTKQSAWPKPYLLELYAEAVKHGMIWVGPITASDATSLKMSLYRSRRRSDAGESQAQWIIPEYHLVTVGAWELSHEYNIAAYGDMEMTDSAANLGRMPVIYNRRPTGMALPGITPASPEETTALAPGAPINQPTFEGGHSSTPTDIPDTVREALNLPPTFNIADFVKDMANKASDDK